MTRLFFLRAFLAFALIAGSCFPASAQRSGEYLTNGEMDLVKEIRDIANRTKVFLKIADRRLLALQGAEYKEGRFEKYGPLPAGSQIELLDDYRKAIDELMVKLDDEFEREKMSDSLKKALGLARQEIERQIKELQALKPKLSQADAARYLEKALDSARLLDEGARKAGG